MSRASATSDALIFGGTPRVHLLPREIEDQRKSQSFRRGLLAGLGLAVAVVVLAVVGVSFLVAAASAGQATEQARSQQLAIEQQKYGSVTEIQAQVDSIKAVQPIATQNEILWVDLVTRVQASLPPDIGITTYDISVGDASDGGIVDPLIGVHVGTMSLTAVGTQVAISQWLINLASVEGVVTAVPGEVAVSDVPGVYRVTVKVFLNNDVFSHRFETSQ